MSDVDVLVRGGTILDGSGEPARTGDVAIRGDRIVGVGDLGAVDPKLVVDAEGLAVAPGFINMMSWSPESLIEDGRSQSDLRQGVTLEVLGEGLSMGPLTAEMKDELDRRGLANPLVEYEIEWRTLGEFLGWLERRGISANVASFVGASTVRIHELGYEARPPTEDELDRMCGLVREAMAEGALGVASALIYPPATSSTTEELVALASAAAEFGGSYASHIRGEGAALLGSIAELIEIAGRSGARAEIYHLKATGRPNWPKLGRAIEIVEAAPRACPSRPTSTRTTTRARGSTRASRRGRMRAGSTRSSNGCGTPTSGRGSWRIWDRSWTGGRTRSGRAGPNASWSPGSVGTRSAT